MFSSPDLSRVPPRVLIVSRRCVRKNKFVDFVGEYHLDLIVGNGAVPVIVPRVAGVNALLDSFEPIHGVLLCEGEDIDPSLYSNSAALSPEQLEEVRRLHPSDAAVDHSKDSIELLLARRCVDRGIPFLGICRGSQVLNVACGGTLYQDVEHELSFSSSSPSSPVVRHINYDDYDGHRHPVRVVPGTPLHDWFADSLPDSDEAEQELMVNSYHHQGVRRLAARFAPMAFAPDGLVEGFYDPDAYDPAQGKFAVGLQFHPERMRKADSSDELEYPGCARTYRDFVRAVVAYQDKVTAATQVPRGFPATKMNKEMQKQRKAMVPSLSLAKDLYVSGGGRARPATAEQRDLDAGAEFLEVQSNTALSVQQEKRLKQMGATVRNASGYINSLIKTTKPGSNNNADGGRREAAARALMAEMTADQLSSLASFYDAMGKICAEVLDRKLQQQASLQHVQV